MVDRNGASPAREGLAAFPRRNFASAEYEPTDDDLLELSREAFAGVREANETATRKMRERIARRGAELVAALEARRKASGDAR